MTSSARTRRQQDDEDWDRFLRHAWSAMGEARWTSRELLGRLEPAQLHWQVEDALRRKGVDSAARTLGKLMAVRRGWRGELLLESFGDGSEALCWQLRTLDEVLG